MWANETIRDRQSLWASVFSNILVSSREFSFLKLIQKLVQYKAPNAQSEA